MKGFYTDSGYVGFMPDGRKIFCESEEAYWEMYKEETCSLLFSRKIQLLIWNNKRRYKE